MSNIDQQCISLDLCANSRFKTDLVSNLAWWELGINISPHPVFLGVIWGQRQLGCIVLTAWSEKALPTVWQGWVRRTAPEHPPSYGISIRLCIFWYSHSGSSIRSCLPSIKWPCVKSYEVEGCIIISPTSFVCSWFSGGLPSI